MTAIAPARFGALLILTATTFACSAAPPPVASPPLPRAQDNVAERRLYQAAMAAAELSLRLHEIDRVEYWLEQAPPAQRGWEWRYLRSQADQTTETFAIDRGTITDITVSTDGKTLAVTTGDSAVLLVDAHTGSIVQNFAGHTAAVWSPVFSRDGKRLATASSDGSARIWDVATGRQLQMMAGNGRGVAAVAWSPDHRQIAVSSWDRTTERGVFGTLNVWNAETGEKIKHLEHGRYPIGSLTYTHDGKQLIGGTWDFDLVVWDTHTWGAPTVLPPPESPDYKRLNDFALSADGRTLIAAHADGRARIWDIAKQSLERTLYAPSEGQLKGLNDVAWLAGGKLAASVGDDLTLRVWDATSGRTISVLHGHRRAPLTVAASPDGTRLYTGGAEGTIRVWDMPKIRQQAGVWNVPHTVYTVAFNPDDTQAVLATWEGWLRVYDVASGTEQHAWQAHGATAVGADWSADGRWIASTGRDGKVTLWDAATRQPLKDLQNVGTQLESVAFDATGTLLAAPTGKSTAQVWSVPAGEPVATLAADGAGTAHHVVWGPAGWLAVTHNGGQVTLWNTRTWKLQSVLMAGGSRAPVVAFEPGRGIIGVANGRELRFWDLATGARIGQPATLSGGVARLAFSPSGDRIAVAYSGSLFAILDGHSGDELLRIPHTGQTWSVGWTADNDLVLNPLDQTIRIVRGGR